MTLEERFMSHVRKTDGCWQWIGTRQHKYGLFYIGYEKIRAHRAAYRLFVAEIPDGLCVCHRCDNPLCVNPEHLFLGTYADNNRDAREKGRVLPLPAQNGERNAAHKLTLSQVLDLIRNCKRGEQSMYARKLGVAHSRVNDIMLRKRWTVAWDIIDGKATL